MVSPRLATSAAFLVAAAVLIQRASQEAWTTDDALITFRYVENWVAGRGLAFNPGEPIEGFSNFLYVVVLAPFAWLGADLFVVGNLLGVIFALGELALLVWIIWRCTGSALASAAGALMFATDRTVAVWTTGGLETSMHGAILLGIFALVVVHRAYPSRGVAAVSLLHVALAASRPEGLAYYVLYLGFLVAQGWRTGAWRTDIRRSLNWALPAFAILIGLRFWYYGDLVANTYEAKMAGVPRLELGLLYVSRFAARMGLTSPLHLAAWLALGAALVYAARRRPAPPALAPVVALALVYIGFAVVIVAWMGGDYMADFRFFRPTIGIVYVAVACALAAPLSGSFLGSRARGAATCAALAAALAVSHGIRQHEALPISSDAPASQRHKEMLGASQDGATRFRRALRLLAEPGDALLVDRAGVRGYGHSYRTYDATGLLSANIARDFYLRDAFDERGVRQRFPGHARWPRLDYMQREGFAFIYPKLSPQPPSVPEITRDSQARRQEYPFLHVTVGVGPGEFLRFFTTLTRDEIYERAMRRRVPTCVRVPFGPLECFEAPHSPSME